MTRILIVDDHVIVQEYFKMIVENNSDYVLAGVIDDANLADVYCGTGKVDLILMDVCTANNNSGLEASKNIKAKYPNIKIIIVTSMPEISFIEKAKSAGCESFWYKEAPKKELEEVIRRTIKGESVYPFDTPSVEIGNALSMDFSQRELDILRQLVSGKNQTEIAEENSISRDTVKYHIRNMLQKTGYDSAVKLIIDVVEKRLIIPNY